MDLVGTWELILTEVEGDVTETPAGQPVLRNYFEVDGAPGVSYETFQRVD